MDEVWRIMSDQLCFISWAYRAQIHSFVLMDNHFHLMISTPAENLSSMMMCFMRETTRYMNRWSGRINQAYGTRHFRSLIGSPHYFLHAYKYIYRNPVEAGLSESCLTYKYSSLAFLLGETKASFPVIFDNTLFSDVTGTLTWLDRKPGLEDWTAVERAMHRKTFRLAKNKATKKEHHLNFDML